MVEHYLIIERDMYCFVSEMTSTRTRESQTLNKTVTIIMGKSQTNNFDLRASRF